MSVFLTEHVIYNWSLQRNLMMNSSTAVMLNCTTTSFVFNMITLMTLDLNTLALHVFLENTSTYLVGLEPLLKTHIATGQKGLSDWTGHYPPVMVKPDSDVDSGMVDMFETSGMVSTESRYPLYDHSVNNVISL